MRSLTPYSFVTDLRRTALLYWVQERLSSSIPDLIPLNGDASLRRYFRAGDYIAADSPPDSQKNPEFLRINENLARSGIRVPKIIAYDLDQGFFLLEDLGTTHFFEAAAGSEEEIWYQKAVFLAVSLNDLEDPKLPSFDRAFMEMELGIFTEWLLDKRLGLKLAPSDQKMLRAAFDFLEDRLSAQRQIAMHRDFHCRNLMVKDGEIAVIDYQDMVRGPYAYDLASLLYDCYVVLDEGLRRRLTAYALSLLKERGTVLDLKTLESDMRLCAIQRHLKVLGIFNRLALRDHKEGYLKDLPRVLNYLLENTALFPELSALRSFLMRDVQGRI